MVLRKFIFKAGSQELQLPITPPSFTVEHGINVETINIHTLGDVNIAGYGMLTTVKIECLFPARQYPFSSNPHDPYSYVETFKKWSADRNVVRFIVSGTPVNLAVLVQSISFSEQDGTNDVYATINLREYRELAAVQTQTSGTVANNARVAGFSISPAQSYAIQSGDTLSSICRKFYGDAVLYPKLAAANNIKNPNLINAGDTLTIPDKNRL